MRKPARAVQANCPNALNTLASLCRADKNATGCAGIKAWCEIVGQNGEFAYFCAAEEPVAPAGTHDDMPAMPPAEPAAGGAPHDHSAPGHDHGSMSPSPAMPAAGEAPHDHSAPGHDHGSMSPSPAAAAAGTAGTP
jgi:hypothetical protein